MNKSLNSHQKDSNPIVAWVWYEGTDALYLGEAVCKNSDYEGDGATYADGRRSSHVERPTTSNNRKFAGVAARNYSAKSTGQLIEIYTPGSEQVECALGVDTVLDTGLITFGVCGKYDVGAEGGDGNDGGRFYNGQYRGRGSAVPSQTVTALLESNMTGGWSLAADGVTLTVSSTTGISAGDTVVLVGGEDDGTDTVVPGKYEVSSVTDSTTLVLTATAGSETTGTSAVTCTGYCYTGNPTVTCDLLDGEESGGVEFINVANAGGSSNPYMVGGVTYVCGGLTLSADVECELAQGVFPGETKTFEVLGTLGSYTFVVDLVVAGLSIDRSTALGEVQTMDAADDVWYGEFRGAQWYTMGIVGGTTEST